MVLTAATSRGLAEPDADLTRPPAGSSKKQTVVSYSYRAYGLGVVSSHAIPGLGPARTGIGAPDVEFQQCGEPQSWVDSFLPLPNQTVSHKDEPHGSPDPSFRLIMYGQGSGYELNYSDGTRFLVDARGERVWGTYRPPLTTEDLATYFLGPVMGFLLRRRQVMSLHASAVDIGGRAVCFCGDAGSGKSTTAAAFALRGRPVLAEDIVPLREAGGQVFAVPGYPRVCVWPESAHLLLGSEDALPALTPVWEKRYLDLDGRRARFAAAELPLAVLYLLGERRSESGAPRIEAVTAAAALLYLVQNTYMNWVLDKQQRAAEFDALSRLVRTVAVRRIVPHADPAKLGELCKIIEDDALSERAGAS